MYRNHEGHTTILDIALHVSNRKMIEEMCSMFVMFFTFPKQGYMPYPLQEIMQDIWSFLKKGNVIFRRHVFNISCKKPACGNSNFFPVIITYNSIVFWFLNIEKILQTMYQNPNLRNSNLRKFAHTYGKK